MYFAPHTHTDKSDGLKPPAAAVQEAIGLGISKYAITDHETIDAFFDPTLQSFMGVAGDDSIELISGVELSTIGGIQDSPITDIEMIGLFFDLHAEPINEVCRHNQEIRREWKRKTFEVVNEFFDFTGSEVIDDNFLEWTNSGKINTVGKPHFIKALLSHPKVDQWLRSRRELDHLIKDKLDYEKEVKKEIDAALKEDVRKKIYTEFLFSMFRSRDEKPEGSTSDEYRGLFYIPKYFVKLEEGIQAIRDSGGVVVIPHAFVSAKKVGMNVKEFLALFTTHFQERNVVGVETEYPILPKYMKYYEKYGKGRRITRPIEPGRRDSDRYPTIEKELTPKEMQQYANNDMKERIDEFETKIGLSRGSIIRLKVSDCHFGDGEHLMRFCSGQDEYDQLINAKG